jgi:prepilin-type N-terminal cleavage/methylation domain-containing protein
VNRQGGFTLVELLIASAALVVLLFGGALVSGTALDVAGDSVRSGAAESRAMHAEAILRQRLVLAGRSTLFATPAAGGAPEAMLDGVSYDNVSFRETVASAREGSTYDPDPALPPLSFAFKLRTGARAEGDLVLTDGSGSHSVCGGVRSVEFVRQGSCVTIRVVTVARGAEPPTCEAVRTLVLRNP